MTHTARQLPSRTTVNSNGRRRGAPSAACQARIQLISDGVVASYIHDISVRHRQPRREPVAAGELR